MALPLAPSPVLVLTCPECARSRTVFMDLMKGLTVLRCPKCNTEETV